MKTIQSAPEGDNPGNTSKADLMMQEAIRKAKEASPDGPHYGDGSTYEHAHYAVGDPGVPINEGAKVKMELSSRSNENLQGYVGNHITQMTGNPNFTTPAPTAPVFLGLFQTFQTALATAMSAKTAYEDALTARDAARAALVEAMNTRGAYVQTASNGNTNVIVSSGLNVRNAPTPVGQLAPPADLKAELNGVAGVVKLQWKATPNARGYLVQCSPDVHPREFTNLANTTKPRAQKELVVGETYVFRVAASGGSTGQSYWSPEVIRGAA
jgi:hypothetical protein